jgi:predicted RNA-binding protein associated with RNAse of E/G family
MNRQAVDVIKLNLDQVETWRYTGWVISRETNSILLEAYFNREDTPFHGILLGRGDRFVERFYADRWYNIFEMHDREDGRLKGWYCNICLPAQLGDDRVAYVDLALDLLVYPDGRQLVLDEDEFADLQLQPDMRLQAEAALADLQALFRQPGSFSLT